MYIKEKVYQVILNEIRSGWRSERVRGGLKGYMGVRVGEVWAYYLLQYLFFPCKTFYIENKWRRGRAQWIFSWFVIFGDRKWWEKGEKPAQTMLLVFVCMTCSPRWREISLEKWVTKPQGVYVERQRVREREEVCVCECVNSTPRWRAQPRGVWVVQDPLHALGSCLAARTSSPEIFACANVSIHRCLTTICLTTICLTTVCLTTICLCV